jgi:hypothetical protein
VEAAMRSRPSASRGKGAGPVRSSAETSTATKSPGSVVSHDPANLLNLQRRFGNEAVSSLFALKRTKAPTISRQSVTDVAPVDAGPVDAAPVDAGPVPMPVVETAPAEPEERASVPVLGSDRRVAIPELAEPAKCDVASLGEEKRPPLELPVLTTDPYGGDRLIADFALSLSTVFAARKAPEVADERFAHQRKTAAAAARTAAAKEKRKVREDLARDAANAVIRPAIVEVEKELAVAREQWMAEDYAKTLKGAYLRWGGNWLKTGNKRVSTKEKELRRKPSKGKSAPTEEEIHAQLTKLYCEQQDWITQQIRNVEKGWMVGRREDLDFLTLMDPKIKPLGKDFKPPVDQVAIEPIRGGTGYPVTPDVNRFLVALRDAGGGDMVANNREGHGGGDFAGRGYSLDITISSPVDDRGFWLPKNAIMALMQIDAAASASGVDWRVLYNDFAVAAEVNKRTGRRNVTFQGTTRKKDGSLNWHGPLILHFHLDIVPLASFETSAPAAPVTGVDSQASTASPAQRVVQPVQRAPAPPVGPTRDASQLSISVTPTKVDALQITRSQPGERPDLKNVLTVSSTSASTNLMATWYLYDPRGLLIDQTTTFVSHSRTFTGADFRDHLLDQGSAATGQWTVRCQKGGYVADTTIDISGNVRRPSLPLTASTTESFYTLRTMPSVDGRPIGELTGKSVPVLAYNKFSDSGHRWVAIRLGAAVGKMPAGQEGWITADAVNLVSRWEPFMDQLRQFEKANAGLSLDQQITKLRQMSHNEDLPFDAVIGTGSGSEYLDTRTSSRGEWELLRDSQQVKTPDGRVVDVFHLLVGLDVLPRRVESQSITVGGLIPVAVGQNYSAATWSGDIGAAAADASIKKDKTWESHNPTASLADRQDRYYQTRVPEADLLGDIDAWGIDEIRPGTEVPATLSDFIGQYYGDTTIAASGREKLVGGRRAALERFLRHYRFNTDSALRTQPAAKGMADQVEIFAGLWILRDSIWNRPGPISRVAYIEPMTNRFLDWLDAEAARNSVKVPAASGSKAPVGAANTP